MQITLTLAMDTRRYYQFIQTRKVFNTIIIQHIILENKCEKYVRTSGVYT